MTIPFQFLWKCVIPVYMYFRKMLSSLFWLLVQSIATPHLWLLREEKKVGPSNSFFHTLSSWGVLYVSFNNITPHFLDLKYWNILFLLFLFCRPLTFKEAICKFPISFDILTHLLIHFMLYRRCLKASYWIQTTELYLNCL